MTAHTSDASAPGAVACPPPSSAGSAGSRTRAVLRAAMRQASIELRIQLLSWSVLGWVLFPAIGLVVLLFLQDEEVLGTEVSLAQIGIPGVLAMTLITSGVLGVASQLLTERDDGTLLRAKAAPNGILSHLVGNVVIYVGTALGPLLVLLAASAVLVDGVSPSTAGGWMRLVWVSVLGLTATIPTGAVLGAVVRNPIMLGWMSLLIYGTMAVSGVFYPLSAFPDWLQIVGRLLPTYWMGLGLRSALLPAEAIELELGQSWQTFQTVAALGTWTVAGLVLAPIALQRMARRQSGSHVAAARERVMAKGY